MAIGSSPEAMRVKAPDYDEIVRVIHLYVDGYNGDIGKRVRRCTRTRGSSTRTATVLCTEDFSPNAFEAWASEPGHAIVGRIISVTQAGDIASVLLGFDDTNDLSGGWVDIHALIRTDGVWKITNKTATHGSRAAWAAPETMGASTGPALPE